MLVCLCGAGICAWCLTDCGESAQSHAHVLTCEFSLNRGSFFGTKEQFEECHRVRRRDLVLKRLEKETEEVQNKTKALLAVALENLGIVL